MILLEALAALLLLLGSFLVIRAVIAADTATRPIGSASSETESHYRRAA